MHIVLGFSAPKNYVSMYLLLHYYLVVQANQKKIVQKNRCYFSIYGRNGIIQ